MNFNLIINNKMSVVEKIMVLIRWIIFISLIGYASTMNMIFIYSGISTVIFILGGLLYYNMCNISGIGTEGFRADNNILIDPPINENLTENLYLENLNSNTFDGENTNQSLINISTNKNINSIPLSEVLHTDYYKQSHENPFGNMLLPEIKYNVDRKSAPPSFNVNVAESITKNVKRAIQSLNPGIKNTNKQLFGDLYNNFVLDNANRVLFNAKYTCRK